MVQRVVVVDRDMGLKKILLDVDALANAEVLVGIQSGSKTHVASQRGRTQKAGKNIAAYAAENEFGVPQKKIPERSFMRTAFDENLNIIEPFVEKQYGAIIDGDKSISNGLGLIGQLLEGAVKTKIRQIREPKNSKFTIAQKKSDKPLIDFGQMFAAVRYVVKIRKK